MNVSTAPSDDQLEEDYVILADSVVTDALHSISLESLHTPQIRTTSPPPPPPPPPPLPPPTTALPPFFVRRDHGRQAAGREQEGGHAARPRDAPQPHPRHRYFQHEQHGAGRHSLRPQSGGHFIADSQQQENVRGKPPPAARQRRRTHDEQKYYFPDEGDSVDAPDTFRGQDRGKDQADQAEEEDEELVVEEEQKGSVRGQPQNIQSHSEGSCRLNAHDRSRFRTPSSFYSSSSSSFPAAQAKRAVSDSRLGVKEGSRSPKFFSRALEGRDQDAVAFCEGGNAGAACFGPGRQTSGAATVIHINHMSEYQMRVFAQESSEAPQSASPSACDIPAHGDCCTACEDEAGVEPGVDGNPDAENPVSVMSLVSELVGGLDSQIGALCRNLEVLLLTWGPGTGREESAPGEERRGSGAEKANGESSDVSVTSLDETERYFDFLAATEDRQESQSSVKHAQSPPSTNSASKIKHVPHVPPRGVHVQRDAPSKAGEQAREWLEIAEATHSKRASPLPIPLPPRPPPRPPKSLPPLLSHDPQTGPPGERFRPAATLKSGSEGTPVTPAACHRQEVAARAGQAQSMLTLPPRAVGRVEPLNVFEVCTESCSASDSMLDRLATSAGQGRSEQGREEGDGGAGVESLVSRELSQVFEQSDVLRAMWNNHKMQLCDLLASREREAARADRIEQGLLRARNTVASLRHQRRDLHHYLEQKEEEWAAALRCHRNEASFLRRKVLTGLEEKKSVMAVDSKREGKLASVLDSLLSLHMDREHFLALDMAKQNKIHELKLLAVRQQLALEEMKERNADLNHALTSLLQCIPAGPGTTSPYQARAPCDPHPHPRATTTSTSTSTSADRGGAGGGARAGLGPRGPGFVDMLYCDHSAFLPNHPTAPELAAVSVFSVGGEQQPISSPVEEIFDASRQRCYADGDHYNHNANTIQMAGGNLAEQLLRELTLHGPGSPDFTLTDSN